MGDERKVLLSWETGGCYNGSQVGEIKQVGQFSYGYVNFQLPKWYSDIQTEKSIFS